MGLQPQVVRRIRLLTELLFLLATSVMWSHEQDMFFFDPAPASQDVKEGDDLLIRCDVSNRNLISFYWAFNGKTLVNSSRRFQQNSDLRIFRVDRNLDNGSFHCVAVNVSTGIAVRSAEARLHIFWLGDLAEVVQQRPPEAGEGEGERPSSSQTTEVWLSCQVDSNPEPTFEWFRNRIKLFGSDRIFLSKNVLRIDAATFSDNGVYSCRARNAAGQVESLENFVLSVPGDVSVPRLNTETFTRVVIARKYSSAIFHCQFQDGVATQWYLDQLHLANTTKYYILINGTLIVNRVDDDDAGGYRCVGTGTAGISQVFVSQLRLTYLNDLTDSSFDPRAATPLIVPVGSRFEVRCLLPKGLPVPTAKWLTPLGAVAATGGRIKESPNGTITINRVEESDTGSYVCEVANLAGMKSRSISLIVSVVPRIMRPPSSQSALEGDGVLLECRFSATPYPATTVTWRKDGQPVDLKNLRIQSNQGILKINDARLMDDGDYSCVVSSKGHSPVTSQSGRLRVLKRLQFRPKPSDVKLQLSSHATISCHADGITTPSISWYKIGHVLPTHVHDDSAGSLVFSGVTRSDAGLYVCLATNNQGTINATIRVDVFVKPVFTVRPGNLTAVNGKPVTLPCSASGEPVPSIHWDRIDSVETFDPIRFKTTANGSLLISKAFEEDAGGYRCVADNGGGREEAEIYLSVQAAALPESSGGGGMVKTIIIAVCSVAAYLGAMIALTVFCVVRRMRRQPLQQTTNENGRLNESTQLMRKAEKDLLGSRSDGDSRSQSSQNSHFFPRIALPSDVPPFQRQSLHILGLLGKGQYGDVLLAHNLTPAALHPLVSVKTLASMAVPHQAEFQRDMELFSKSNHNNIARLIGICCSLQPPILVIEYCEWGDLKQFLISLNTDTSRTIQSTVTLAQQLEMCRQVAVGMEHLSTNHLVHKDLAARNVLVTPFLDLKISMLSLCRDIRSADYVLFQDCPIPLRWMPAESVFHGDFSTSSDAWAFGVLVLEVFQFGGLPLMGKTDDEILMALKAGMKLHSVPPSNCPEALWKLVQRCTSVHPVDRPSFTDVVNILGSMICDSGV